MLRRCTRRGFSQRENHYPAASRSNSFAFHLARVQFGSVTRPLALIYFQSPLVGNQLVNRLQDMQYRVNTAGTTAEFLNQARDGGIMLVLADVEGADEALLETLRTLRTEEATRHIPIIAFSSSQTTLDYAQKAGCTIAVEASVLLAHLPQILEQALQLE